MPWFGGYLPIDNIKEDRLVNFVTKVKSVLIAQFLGMHTRGLSTREPISIEDSLEAIFGQINQIPYEEDTNQEETKAA